MSEDQLQAAIKLFKDEKKEEASKLLTALLEQEPGNELAWLWLAACTAHPEERRYCLEKALEINPENQKARTALERMQPTPLPTAAAAESAPTSAAPSNPHEAANPPAVITTRRQPGKKMTLYRKILIGVFSLLMLVVLGFIFIAFISGAFTF